MQRSILFSALIAIFICGSAVSSQTVQRWQNISSSAGRFEALYPAAPTTSSYSKDTSAGKVSNTAVVADLNDSAFLVMYADWPFAIEDVQASLTVSQKGVLRDMNATLISSQPTNVTGYQALLYKVSLPQANGEKFIGTVLVLFVGRRQYQVIVVQPEAKASTAEASKFISSFKLIA